MCVRAGDATQDTAIKLLCSSLRYSLAVRPNKAWIGLYTKLEKGISKMGFAIYDIASAKQNLSELYYEVP